MLGNAKDGSVLNLLSIFWRFHVWSIVLNSQWQIFQLCQFHVLCNHLHLSVPLAELCFTTCSHILSFFFKLTPWDEVKTPLFLILCHFLFQICEGGDVKIPWSISWSDQLEEQTALYMTAMYSNTLNSIFIYKAFLTVYLSVFISFYPPSIF